MSFEIGYATALNKKILMIDAAQVLEIEPVARTTALIGSVYSSAQKWSGAALAPNGKIYCAPVLSASQILEIDPLPKSTDFQKYLLLPENIAI